MVLRQAREKAATLLVMQSRPWNFPNRPADTTPSQSGDQQISVRRLRTP